MAEMKERTFLAIKPDGVQRGIIGDIIKRFETKGFKLVGMKMLHVSKQCLFYNALAYNYLEVKGYEIGCLYNSQWYFYRGSVELISLLVYS